MIPAALAIKGLGDLFSGGKKVSKAEYKKQLYAELIANGYTPAQAQKIVDADMAAIDKQVSSFVHRFSGWGTSRVAGGQLARAPAAAKPPRRPPSSATPARTSPTAAAPTASHPPRIRLLRLRRRQLRRRRNHPPPQRL